MHADRKRKLLAESARLMDLAKVPLLEQRIEKLAQRILTVLIDGDEVGLCRLQSEPNYPAALYRAVKAAWTLTINSEEGRHG
jgi:hypothetical protein